MPKAVLRPHRRAAALPARPFDSLLQRNSPLGERCGFTTEIFKQERSFQEVHMNNSLRGRMGSYQPAGARRPLRVLPSCLVGCCVPYIGFFHLSQQHSTVTHLSKRKKNSTPVNQSRFSGNCESISVANARLNPFTLQVVLQGPL